MSADPSPVAWPPVSPARLAESVAALAARVGEPEIRTQLHALGAVLANLGAERDGAGERALLVAEIEGRLQRGESVQPPLLRRLAALDRAAVQPVDWSAASSG